MLFRRFSRPAGRAARPASICRGAVQPGQVLEAGRNVRMIGAENLLADRQYLLLQFDRLGVSTLAEKIFNLLVEFSSCIELHLLLGRQCGSASRVARGVEHNSERQYR